MPLHLAARKHLPPTCYSYPCTCHLPFACMQATLLLLSHGAGSILISFFFFFLFSHSSQTAQDNCGYNITTISTSPPMHTDVQATPLIHHHHLIASIPTLFQHCCTHPHPVQLPSRHRHTTPTLSHAPSPPQTQTLNTTATTQPQAHQLPPPPCRKCTRCHNRHHSIPPPPHSKDTCPCCHPHPPCCYHHNCFHPVAPSRILPVLIVALCGSFM